jgi:hypothetical protein
MKKIEFTYRKENIGTSIANNIAEIHFKTMKKK